VLDTVTRTALFGVRFWDRVTGRVVSDGLEVVEAASGAHAAANGSGVFVLHELPGMRASEFGAGDDAFWASPPTAEKIVFTVVDTLGRFMPFAFTADVPLRGLFVEDCGLPAASPPDAVVGGVPLFSAPTRVPPAAIAAVRADLWDVGMDAPAAWAVLEVTAAGEVYRGVADARGTVVVLFPYPEPPWHGSSPPPGSRALSQQQWPLTLTVRYGPAYASPPLPDPAAPSAAPDLCAVLTQPAGTLLAVDSPHTALGSQTLAFGRELVLRTPGLSVLHVLSA
jgi:hypothetical protein